MPTGAAASIKAFPISLLAAAGFASGAGIRLLDPLLPLVAGDFGVSVAAASVVVAGFMLPYGLGQLITGPLGDRMGKVRVASFALFFYGLAMLSCSLAVGLPMLVVLRALSGLFAGAIIPLLMAHIGDTVPYGERQATIGQFLTGMVMAQMLTGPVAGVVGEFTGWRGAFAALGALTLAIFLLIALRLRGALWRAPTAGGARGQGLHAYLILLAHPAGRWLLIAAFFDGFCLFGASFPYIGSYLIQTFGLTAGLSGIVVAGFGLGSFLYTRLSRRLVRWFGECWLLASGGLGLALGIAVLAVVSDWREVVPIQILLGLFFYMFHGVLQARATEVMPEARGTAVSAFALALFVGQTTGSLAFGGLLAFVDYRPAFVVTASLTVVLALWASTGLRRVAPDPARRGH
jgi:DHA1 family inner membrane transport protein